MSSPGVQRKWPANAPRKVNEKRERERERDGKKYFVCRALRPGYGMPELPGEIGEIRPGCLV